MLETERPSTCTLGYDAALNAVVITWLHNDVFRPMLEQQLVLVRRHRATTVIVDTSMVKGLVNNENQDWLSNDYFARLSSSGLAALISVVPKSAIAAPTNLPSFRGHDVSFDMVEVASLEAAQACAQQYAAALSA